MFNPSMLMKLMNARNQFSASHPKFVAFLNAIFSQGINEGCVIEITVTRPDGRTITGNMRVTESDMQLMEEMKDLARQNQ